MKNKRLTIGIVDGVFLSLQERLLEEGHYLKVYLPHFSVSDPIPSNEFNVTGASHCNDFIEHVVHISDLADCDYVICETLNNEGCYEYLRMLNVPVIGHSLQATLLETDRMLAKIILEKAGVLEPGFLKLPTRIDLDTTEQVREALTEATGKFVIKQNRNSPAVTANPTMVIDDVQSFLPLLDKANSWFDAKGNGGCILEEKIEGQEVCFGAWFDGVQFIGPMYSCIEHKGAQNNDRGNILTGEVGTTLFMHTDRESRMWRVFRMLESHLEGTCCGMVDINTILQPEGDQYFLEFTMRFGRPTLDMMIVKMKRGFDFGHAMAALIERNPTRSNRLWKDAYHTGYSVGVTVMSYGYPVVDQLIEQLPADVRDRAWDLLTSRNVYVNLASDTHYRMRNDEGGVVQLFAQYIQSEKSWKLDGRGRHFVFVGHGMTPEVASANAYAMLKGQSFLGCTWRDDIGQNLPALASALVQHGIA